MEFQMTSSGLSKYSFKSTVKSYETDALGRISLSNMLYNFQEAANHHASMLGWGMEYLDSINKFWILSRLKVAIGKYPVHKDEITIDTWSRGAEGFFAYRDYRVWLNNACCIDAVSSWMILDKTSHRPCKIEQIGKEIPGTTENYLRFPDTKIPVAENRKLLFEKKVNFSDIDINLHVNNGKYAEILTDAIADKLIQGCGITEIDIQYLHESQIGDVLMVYATEDAESTSGNLFTMENQTKGKETCRCRLNFRRQDNEETTSGAE